ncbi:MAG TPA: type II toxin-antitoxin system RelE/ParE family toxin [Planctomycetota bacterium]|nr:type II toxin-antitoxin system RelE/ParE family toxin [Planctomycetota bacterium]
MGAWTVTFEERVADDLQWFAKKERRLVFESLMSMLEDDPTVETKNVKTLRANRFAQRELRIRGKYRVLFNVDTGQKRVLVLAIGEKQGERLVVRGEEFTAHHEDDPT